MKTGGSKTRSQATGSDTGWTLVEMLVATGISSLVLGALMILSMFTARSFAALGNYSDLDRASRNALDTLTSEIRGARSVGSWSTNQLVLTNAVDGTVFSYTYNPTNSTLTRQWGADSNVLLTGCDYFYFHIWLRNPTNGFAFPYSATNQVYLAKLVDVSWKCSRQILGNKVNTESVQTASIVIRN